MKKKIALLLAVIMAMSAVPTTIFASSDNKLNRTVTNVRDASLLLTQPSLRTGSMNYTGDYDTFGDFDGKKTEYADTTPAPNLILELNDKATLPTAFRVKLDGATWITNLANSTGTTSIAAIKASGIANGTGTVTYVDAYTYNYTGGPLVAGQPADISYKFQVNKTNRSEATVTLTTAAVKDDVLSIPLSLFVENNNTNVTAEVIANSSAFSSGKYAVVSTTSGNTVNSFATVKTGKESITLDTLILQETRVNTLYATAGNANGRGMRITAPAGYEFSNLPGLTSNDWQITDDGTANVLMGTPGAKVNYKLDGTTARDVVYLRFEGLAGTSSLPGAIYINNIKIEPTDIDSVPVNTTVKMGISKYKNSNSETWKELGGSNYPASTKDEFQVGTGSIDAAKVVDWAVTLTANTPKDIIAGRWYSSASASEVQVADVTFKEEEVGAWLSTRTTEFTLPKGVKLRGIEYRDEEHITTTLTDRTSQDFDDKTGKWTDNLSPITYSESSFSLKNITVENGKKALVVIRMYLSVDPNYASDTITLACSGTAVPDAIPAVTVAKVKRPVTVTTKTTDVQIGYQRYDVSDITITENGAGAIRRIDSGDAGLKLALYDGGLSTDLSFNQITDSQIKVTTGDIKVSLDTVNKGVIQLDVDRVSTVPSTIVISGLQLKINRDVPYGVYDLVVFGDSVFNNYETRNASDVITHGTLVTFGKYYDGFLFKNYVNVATEGSNTQKVNTFKVQDGSKTVIINGETTTIADAPYISKTTNRFMLPARWTASLLGVDETKDIIYADATKTVTVMLPARTVQFVVGSDMMTIASNGVTTQVKMDAKAENTNGRVFIPVYALAQAYGAKLGYDDTTKTATFN